MATDKELSQFAVNEVESDEKLNEISQSETLGANQIFVTKDGASFDNAVGLPIGAIFPSAIPIVDARVHLLDGSYIAQDGVYEEFAELIKSLDASGQPITCSEAKFEEDVALTGNCGKFVINNQTRTIRLPRITTFIQGLGSIADIGTSLNAGLPNIEGSLKVNYTYSATPFTQQQNGALKASRDGNSEYYVSGRASGSGWANDIHFNARNSNDIYGSSDTVQPQATQFPYYIVLASGYKSKKSVNIDNIISEVKRKPFIDNIYPVGSIYLSLSENFSPARAFGGTWERIENKFLLGAGGAYALGDEGGEATHTLTTSEMPSHSHIETWAGKDGSYYTYELTYNSGSSWGMNVTRITSATPANSAGPSYLYTRGTGGSGSHNNMPPYLAVYMWRRLPDDENGSEVENYPYYGDGSGGEVDNY